MGSCIKISHNHKMVVVMFVSFLLVLFFVCLSDNLAFVCNVITNILMEENKKLKILENELFTLNKDLKKINMMDEFAKYAKTERRIIRIKDEIKKENSVKSGIHLKVKIVVHPSFQFMRAVIFIGLLWKFRSSSLMYLPPQWLWPLNKLIAFPSGVPDGLGITFWLMVCRSLITQLTQFYVERKRLIALNAKLVHPSLD